MDYQDLVEHEKEVATAVALHGGSAECHRMIFDYKKVRDRYLSNEPISLKAAVPKDVRDAFIPIWDMFRECYGEGDKDCPPELPA